MFFLQVEATDHFPPLVLPCFFFPQKSTALMLHVSISSMEENYQSPAKTTSILSLTTVTTGLRKDGMMEHDCLHPRPGAVHRWRKWCYYPVLVTHMRAGSRRAYVTDVRVRTDSSLWPVWVSDGLERRFPERDLHLLARLLWCTNNLRPESTPASTLPEALTWRTPTHTHRI